MTFPEVPSPGECGILLRTVADATFHYPFLVQDRSGTGRNVTLGRLFTSVPIAEDLAADRLNMAGTVNKTRKLTPRTLKEAHVRMLGSNLFCCRNSVTLVSHCPKTGKVVLLMSIQHQEPLDTGSGRPETRLHYNAKTGGIDVVDVVVES